MRLEGQRRSTYADFRNRSFDGAAHPYLILDVLEVKRAPYEHERAGEDDRTARSEAGGRDQPRLHLCGPHG
jgi:hypothetical protein